MPSSVRKTLRLLFVLVLLAVFWMALLPAPEVRELTPGQPADQGLIKQLVHLIYDVRRDDARFRNRIGVPGSFDGQRKDYPERRELSSLHLNGPFACDRLARLGFAISQK